MHTLLQALPQLRSFTVLLSDPCLLGWLCMQAELAQINQQMSSQPGAWATNGASATQTIDMRDGDESQILGLEAESELQQSRLWTVSQQLNTYESRLTELESSVSNASLLHATGEASIATYSAAAFVPAWSFGTLKTTHAPHCLYSFTARLLILECS